MPDTPEIETARHIVEIVPTVMQIVAAELRRARFPVSPTQLGVLTVLAHHPCNLSELAEHHLVSLPSMSSAISNMVEQGWVQRKRAEHDRRMLMIEISPEGLNVWEKIGRLVISRLTELLAPLTPAERQSLLDGLAVLRKAFAVVPQPFPLEIRE
jgi:DNA-binding MarR family transcriptional regulator